MIEITCKNCGKTAQKRKGSQFCSTKCKNAYWNNQRKTQSNKEQGNTEKNASEVDETEKAPPKTIKKTFQVENPAYVKVADKLNQLKTQESKARSHYKQKKHKIETLHKANNQSLILPSAALGGLTGSKIQTDKPIKGFLGGALLGYLAGAFTDKFEKSRRPQEIAKLKQEAKKLAEKIQYILTQIDTTKKQLHQIAPNIEQTSEIENPDYQTYVKNQKQEEAKQIEKEKLKEQQRKKEQEEKQARIAKLELEQVNEKVLDAQSRILSSTELAKLDFETLDFQGKWIEFIGQPAVNFYMVIHGQPGGGKSTFTIQLAAYLSVKFGNVLYVSGEEGFSKTLQEKLERLDTENDNLDFADLHSLQDILDEVPKDKYAFIVLDSLNNMKIDADGIQDLRKHFPQTATIAIAQSTKEGKMRGSHEIIHDCDIEISVSEGQATTIKNRYKETGLTYQIF